MRWNRATESGELQEAAEGEIRCPIHHGDRRLYICIVLSTLVRIIALPTSPSAVVFGYVPSGKVYMEVRIKLS